MAPEERARLITEMLPLLTKDEVARVDEQLAAAFGEVERLAFEMAAQTAETFAGTRPSQEQWHQAMNIATAIRALSDRLSRFKRSLVSLGR